VLLTAEGVTLKVTAARAVEAICWQAAKASRRIQALRVFAFMRLLALVLPEKSIMRASGRDDLDGSDESTYGPGQRPDVAIL
jgi:hypothetical protein